MPMSLKGSCRCGGVSFTVRSHTPFPYQLCYCSICRKTAGGGGYAINIMGEYGTLAVTGEDRIAAFQAAISDDDGSCRISNGQRSFCTSCGTALWLWNPTWPDLVHPHASAIDTDLPVPPARTHLMLRFKAPWVEPDIGPDDRRFDLYPDESIEDWHRTRGLWAD